MSARKTKNISVLDKYDIILPMKRNQKQHYISLDSDSDE
jgi:hypothetical protein